MSTLISNQIFIKRRTIECYKHCRPVIGFLKYTFALPNSIFNLTDSDFLIQGSSPLRSETLSSKPIRCLEIGEATQMFLQEIFQ